VVKFRFKTYKDAYDYCIGIAEVMVKEFNISNTEAVGRINFKWGGWILLMKMI